MHIRNALIWCFHANYSGFCHLALPGGLDMLDRHIVMSKPPDSPWDLGRLELFVRVAREGSLTRVAAATGSPQPSLSRKICKLEEEFGGRLFLRTGRGVCLSELGTRVLPKVQAVMRELDELSAEVSSQARVVTGEVRIGVLPSLYDAIVIPLLDLQLEKFPGIRMHVQEGSPGQVDPWLANGQIDIGITYRYGQNATPDIERLVRVGSFLIGPPGDALTNAKTIEFRRLDGVPLVLSSPPNATRLVLERLAKRAQITLNVVMEADSTHIQKAAASHTGVYTVMPLHAVADELPSGRLQATRIVEPRIDCDIALGMTGARPASHASREVARLIRSLMTSEKTRELQGGSELLAKMEADPPGAAAAG